ncbi:hypothetical protein R3P38DRAFT_2771016 [Favolaschia claudopus]|uniref:Uncharacterized protein n=1 Tax=Favolaschia claudopus TaxID=2862362 RepID=A0AAW0CG85_9AGAR
MTQMHFRDLNPAELGCCNNPQCAGIGCGFYSPAPGRHGRPPSDYTVRAPSSSSASSPNGDISPFFYTRFLGEYLVYLVPHSIYIVLQNTYTIPTAAPAPSSSSTFPTSDFTFSAGPTTTSSTLPSQTPFSATAQTMFASRPSASAAHASASTSTAQQSAQHSQRGRSPLRGSTAAPHAFRSLAQSRHRDTVAATGQPAEASSSKHFHPALSIALSDSNIRKSGPRYRKVVFIALNPAGPNLPFHGVTYDPNDNLDHDLPSDYSESDSSSDDETTSSSEDDNENSDATMEGVESGDRQEEAGNKTARCAILAFMAREVVNAKAAEPQVLVTVVDEGNGVDNEADVTTESRRPSRPGSWACGNSPNNIIRSPPPLTALVIASAGGGDLDYYQWWPPDSIAPTSTKNNNSAAEDTAVGEGGFVGLRIWSQPPTLDALRICGGWRRGLGLDRGCAAGDLMRTLKAGEGEVTCMFGRKLFSSSAESVAEVCAFDVPSAPTSTRLVIVEVKRREVLLEWS